MLSQHTYPSAFEAQVTEVLAALLLQFAFELVQAVKGGRRSSSSTSQDGVGVAA